MSTKDILENIRKQLEFANNNLKQSAANGEFPEEGDSVNVHEEEHLEQDEEHLDEVRIEEKTPETEKKEMNANIETIKQNLQPVAESVKASQTESLEPDEDWEFLEDEEEEQENQNLNTQSEIVHDEEEIDEPAQVQNSSQANFKASVKTEEISTPEEDEEEYIEEEFHDEDDLQEEEFHDDDLHNEELIEEEAQEAELEEEIPLTAKHEEDSKTIEKTYNYEEDNVHKIPNYTKHELSTETQISTELAEKLAIALEKKFNKMIEDIKSLKPEGNNVNNVINDITVKDLVKEALQPAIENWIDNNQNLIINIVEKVAERNISSAISKIKF